MKKLLYTVLLSLTLVLPSFGQTITGMANLPPGSLVDINLRTLLKRYDEVFGSSSVVVNRPGANGQIGINAFVSDHYTNGIVLLSATHGSIVETSDANFEKLKPVIELGRQSMMLVVRKDFPANTFEEYVAYARSNPGKVNMGAYGLSLAGPIVSTIESKNKYTTNHILYSGTQSSNPENDVAAGTLDSIWALSSRILGTAYQDRVKILAVTTKEKIPGLGPNVRYGTDKNIGEFYLHHTVWTHQRISDSDVEKLNTRFNALLHSEWGQATFSKGHMIVTGGSVEDSVETWKKLRAGYRNYQKTHKETAERSTK